MNAPNFYAGEVPFLAANELQQAAAAYGDTALAEAFLLKAQRLAPEALHVYFALYKFYFYRGRLAEAESMTREGLQTAARLSGFADDIDALSPQTADWFAPQSAPHFYLFSMKALSFIRLRSGDSATCERILKKLAELDPQDTIGWSVIKALLEKI